MWSWEDFTSNSTEILASIIQAVAVLVVNLRPIGTEVFVHLNLRTIMWSWEDFTSNSTEILASIIQAVAVLVVNLRPIRTEVFVHLNLRTINPCSRVERPLFIPIYVPVMSPLLCENLFGILGIVHQTFFAGAFAARLGRLPR